MKTEENIYTKLLKFQKLGISVIKDGKNPHYKSKYATLNEVLEKVKKPLNDLGILIIFAPETDGLRTTLYDVDSATQIGGFMKYVGSDNAQKLLACNTYFRRGTLVSLLGLEDEDDDGNAASKPTVKPQFTEAKFEAAKKANATIEQIKSKYLITPEMEIKYNNYEKN